MLISVKPAYVARLTAQPDTSQTALTALRADMSAFYQREMQCGDRCKAYIVERSPGVFLLSVHRDGVQRTALRDRPAH
jgi:hypothetical protein